MKNEDFLVLNERLTTVLLILKIVFWCVLIYGAVVGVLFFKNTSSIVQDRIANNQPPFALDSLVSVGTEQLGVSQTAVDLSRIRDPKTLALLTQAQQAYTNKDSQTAVQALLQLDSVFAASGNDAARATNQQLLKALQGNNDANAEQLFAQLVQQAQ